MRTSLFLASFASLSAAACGIDAGPAEMQQSIAEPAPKVEPVPPQTMLVYDTGFRCLPPCEKFRAILPDGEERQVAVLDMPAENYNAWYTELMPYGMLARGEFSETAEGFSKLTLTERVGPAPTYEVSFSPVACHFDDCPYLRAVDEDGNGHLVWDLNLDRVRFNLDDFDEVFADVINGNKLVRGLLVSTETQTVLEATGLVDAVVPQPEPEPRLGDATPLRVVDGIMDGMPAFGDGVTVREVRLDGDILEVDVGYGGGCEEHVFELVWDGLVLETFPGQVNLRLTHDGNGDVCEAYIMPTLRFDLRPLGGTADTIIHVNTADGSTSVFPAR